MAARFGSKKAPAAGRRNKSTRTIETYVLRVAQFAKHFGLSRLVEARLLPRRCLAAGAQSSYLFVAEQRTQLAASPCGSTRSTRAERDRLMPRVGLAVVR
jgi:hypothetical protein